MEDKKRPKNLNGFIIESAQGHGLPSNIVPAARKASFKGLARVGMDSLLPNAGDNPYATNKDSVITTTLETKGAWKKYVKENNKNTEEEDNINYHF